MTVSKVLGLADLKKLAKKLQEQEGLKHMASLERAALDSGYTSYLDFVAQDKMRQARAPLPVGLFDAINEGFRVEATTRGVDFSLFWPTATGLEKSIIDATAHVRLHLSSMGLHDFAQQQKGPANKIRRDAKFIRSNCVQLSRVSFYRPVTKNGDPRMWFSGLPNFARPDDTIAIVIDDGVPCLINLSELAAEIAPNLVSLGMWHDGHSSCNLSSLARVVSIDGLQTVLGLLDCVEKAKQSLAFELVDELRSIASRGPIGTKVVGSTAVGRAVEQALGINQNSSKDPDYKGRIELKAARSKPSGKRTRQTLFAQVADWGHAETTFRSSAAILEEYGYQRGGGDKLYCTVSARAPNSQGLSFQLSTDESLLMEVDAQKRVVAVWPLALLAARLLKKHAETFWIQARATKAADGTEYFTLLSATHTKAPLASQLLPLIREGLITMDHLIKRREDGTVSEKGPLFKLAHEGFHLLFPNPSLYLLDV